MNNDDDNNEYPDLDEVTKQSLQRRNAVSEAVLLLKKFALANRLEIKGTIVLEHLDTGEIIIEHFNN